MIHFFIPTSKNNYRAYLLKVPVLLLFIFIISSFNFLVKVDTKAETTDQIINTQNLLDAHNSERTKLGLSPLQLNTQLNDSAQKKAQAMLESNCWSHYCPEGESPWKFFDDANYSYVVAGENLAEGFYNVSDLMTAWMNSQTHRENILNVDYKDIGFGIVKGNYQGNTDNVLVVVHFGTQPDEVENDSSKALSITSPPDGTVVHSDSEDVQGSVSGLDKVDIYLNGQLSGAASIDQGIFTYAINSLRVGDNFIYAQSPLDFGLTKDSNVVKVTYDSAPILTTPSQQVSGVLSTPADLKNLVNILFISGLAILFLMDFLVLTRTSMLQKERSFTHYHFGLLLILVIIILAGGFSGSLTHAIKI